MAKVLCKDSRACCFRDENKACTLLTESYERDGDCPFCKAKKSDIGMRVPREKQASEKLVSAQGFIDKRIEISAKNEKETECEFFLGKPKRLCKASYNTTCEGCKFYSPNRAKKAEALAQHLYRTEKKEIEMKEEINILNGTIEERDGIIAEQ